MYSRNDYRYYLERQLLVSDDYLAHYGVMGMKWGVRHDERRAALVSKRNANTAKISKYQNKLNTVGAQKRAAKAAKYQHKVDKLQRKASKAQKRLSKGKSISRSQMKKLAKYESYKSKVASNSVKNDKYQMKISKLQAKNAKIDKKITKMDARQKVQSINKQRRSELDLIKSPGKGNYDKGDVKQINRYWNDQVRAAKGKKQLTDSGHGAYGKGYDRELIDLALLDAEAYSSKKPKKKR